MKRDAALAYLQAHPDEWIPVTNEETLGSLRELHREGHRLVQRIEDGHREVKYTPPIEIDDLFAKAHAIFGDMVADGTYPSDPCPHVTLAVTPSGQVCIACGEIRKPPITPGEAGRENPLKRRDDGTFEVAYKTCEECGEQYLVRDEHVRWSKRHKTWQKGELDPEIPVPPQPPTFKYPVEMKPGSFEFGATIICPRCHGIKHKAHKDPKTHVRTLCEYTHERGKPDERCIRCNGHGVVPNTGPS